MQKLGENAKDHKAYNEAFDAATRWLADMEEKIQDCNDTAGDWHTLQDRMDAVKVYRKYPTTLNIMYPEKVV